MDKKLYAFELGRKKELCFQELIAVLGEQNLLEKNLDTAVFSLKTDDIDALQNKLGGTIKIIEIVDGSASLKDSELKPKIEKLLKDSFKDHYKGKVPFSLSPLSIKSFRDINIKELLNFSKKILKSFGINARFVNKDFKAAKPSTIYKAKVVQKGIDICVIKGKSKVFLGQTVSIQNIDNYSKRDYKKPVRDAKIGMLPPKLAQIMINLAEEFGGKSPQTIYDPFCGTGTVLMEAMLMGKTAIGSDINKKMIQASETNCQWLKEEFKIDANPKTHADFRIFEKDARQLEKADLPENIDAVITEGYLGPALSKLPNAVQAKEVFDELGALHLSWLKKIHNLTPKHCKVIMCATTFKSKPIQFFPDFPQIAKKAGYKLVKSYLYDREDQVVARDIKILEKI